MIKFHETCIELDVHTAIALLEFATKDLTRCHLGVGISNGKLCATDGHTLIRFEQASEDTTLNHGKVWTRATVDIAVKVAKATKLDVVLRYSDFTTCTFPPVEQVIPDKGFGKKGTGVHVGLDPAYLARMTKVAKACETKGVLLRSMGGELDQVSFTAKGNDLEAIVVIMPMRI
jgi:hypothetical protein